MEVYATIFIIFVSHVLSTFSQTFSSRQRYRRYIPQENIRRIPIVYFQNQNDDINDEENQPDKAAGYLMPFLQSIQERISKSDSNQTTSHYESYKLIKVGNSTEKLPNWPRIYPSNSWKHITESIVRQKNKYQTYDGKNKWVNTKSSIAPSLYESRHKKKRKSANYMEFGINVGNNPQIFSNEHIGAIPITGLPKSGKSLNPWKKLCDACDTPSETTACVNLPTTPPCPGPTMSQCCNTGFSKLGPFPKVTSDTDRPWIFFTYSPKYQTNNTGLKRPMIASAYQWPSTSFIINGKDISYTEKEGLLSSGKEFARSISETILTTKGKQESFYYPKINLDHLFKKRHIYKKRNNVKRETTNDNALLLIPVERNIFRRKLVKKNTDETFIKKWNLEGEGKFKRSEGYAHFPLGFERGCKNINMIPPCQKSCFYNLTALVNARALKPFYYNKKGPSLMLCCTDGNGTSSTKRADNIRDESQALTNTEGPFNGSATVSVNNTDAATPAITDNNTTTIVGNNTTQIIGNRTVSNISQTTTVPPLLNILVQYKDISTLKPGSTAPATPKEEFVLKVMVKNKDENFMKDSESELRDLQWPSKQFLLLKGKKTQKEKPFEGYVMKLRRQKKPKPWNKYCSCEGSSTCCSEVTDVNRMPWVSTCCFGQQVVTTGYYTETGKTLEELAAKTMAHSPSSEISTVQKLLVLSNRNVGSSSQSLKSTGTDTLNKSMITSKANLKRINEKNPEVFNVLQGNAGDTEHILLLVRIPISTAQQLSKNGAMNLVLPFNDTLLHKYVRPRSIFDQFLPSILKKTTHVPTEHLVKPWHEPWKFKPQDKFNLFTTDFGSVINVDHNQMNPQKTTCCGCSEWEHNERLPKTCPSCGNIRADMLFKVTKNPLKSKYIIGENGESKEDSYGKYISYLLNFPKDMLVENSSYPHFNSKLTQTTSKTLRLIQNSDKPPKYFIEVPDTLGELIKKALEGGETQTQTTPKMKNNKKSGVNLVFSETSENFLKGPLPEKKPIVLYLQPFEANGHSVYLPLSGHDVFGKTPASWIDKNYDIDDYLENIDDGSDTSRIKGQGMDDLVLKGKSLFPLALIPVYLTLHPKSRLGLDSNVRHKANKSGTISKQNINSKPVDCVPGLITDSVPIEKKWLSLSQQIENNLQNPLSLVNITATELVTTTRPMSKIIFDKASNSSREKPTYIILMKESSDASPILELDSSHLDKTKHQPNKNDDFIVIEYKGDVTIGPVGETYVIN